MNDRDGIIVRLLAESDSLWLPCRFRGGDEWVNSYLGRQAYITAGIPWRSEGGGDAGRKATQRELEALVADGLVTRGRTGRAKTLAVRLTEAGERRGRQLTLLPDLRESWDLLVDIAGRTKRQPELLLDAWAIELGPAGLENYPSPWTKDAEERLKDVEFRALPSLIRGWLVALSDTMKRVYYAVTPYGWHVLDTLTPPEKAPDIDDWDGDPCGTYARTMRVALDALRSKTPDDTREIGPVPLTASPGGLKFPHAWPPLGHMWPFEGATTSRPRGKRAPEEPAPADAPND
jgi:hypothetical protein